MLETSPVQRVDLFRELVGMVQATRKTISAAVSSAYGEIAGSISLDYLGNEGMIVGLTLPSLEATSFVEFWVLF